MIFYSLRSRSLFFFTIGYRTVLHICLLAFASLALRILRCRRRRWRIGDRRTIPTILGCPLLIVWRQGTKFHVVGKISGCHGTLVHVLCGATTLMMVELRGVELGGVELRGSTLVGKCSIWLQWRSAIWLRRTRRRRLSSGTESIG